MKKILITGASGLIGRAVIDEASHQGFQAVPLRRTRDREAGWDPAGGKIHVPDFESFEAVIHLAGKSIAAGRWTESLKSEIYDSRIQGTSLLATTLAGLKSPPPILISASAVGFYGDRGDTLLTEDSPPGSNFLARVCVDWEKAAQPAVDKGIRVVFMRFGMVLSKNGGALPKLLTPFRLGLGGILGNGQQWSPWVDLEDAVGVIFHCLSQTTLKGPVNVTSPHAVTNLMFTKALGQALHRPTLLPLPAFGAKLIFGEMADNLLLSSSRVIPKKLQESGYKFKKQQLTEAFNY